MGGDPLVVADQGHVHKLVVVAQLAHAVDDVGLVVCPLDAELCARHGHSKVRPDGNSFVDWYLGQIVRLSLVTSNLHHHLYFLCLQS